MIHIVGRGPNGGALLQGPHGTVETGHPFAMQHLEHMERQVKMAKMCAGGVAGMAEGGVAGAAADAGIDEAAQAAAAPDELAGATPEQVANQAAGLPAPDNTPAPPPPAPDNTPAPPPAAAGTPNAAPDMTQGHPPGMLKFTGDEVKKIHDDAQAKGHDPAFPLAVSAAETGGTFDPLASNPTSSAFGSFQETNSFAKNAKIDQHNPDAARGAGVDNTGRLEDKFGNEADDDEKMRKIYASHNNGDAAVDRAIKTATAAGHPEQWADYMEHTDDGGKTWQAGWKDPGGRAAMEKSVNALHVLRKILPAGKEVGEAEENAVQQGLASGQGAPTGTRVATAAPTGPAAPSAGSGGAFPPAKPGTVTGVDRFGNPLVMQTGGKPVAMLESELTPEQRTAFTSVPKPGGVKAWLSAPAGENPAAAQAKTIAADPELRQKFADRYTGGNVQTAVDKYLTGSGWQNGSNGRDISSFMAQEQPDTSGVATAAEPGKSAISPGPLRPPSVQGPTGADIVANALKTNPTDVSPLYDATKAANAGLSDIATKEAAQEEQNSKLLGDVSKTDTDINTARQKNIDDYTAAQNRVDQGIKNLRDYQNKISLDPAAQFRNASVGGKILQGIALALGSVKQAFVGGSNPAQDIFDSAIKDEATHIQNQMAKAKAGTDLAEFQSRMNQSGFTTREQQGLATSQLAREQVITRIQAAMAHTSSQEQRDKLQLQLQDQQQKYMLGARQLQALDLENEQRNTAVKQGRLGLAVEAPKAALGIDYLNANGKVMSGVPIDQLSTGDPQGRGNERSAYMYGARNENRFIPGVGITHMPLSKEDLDKNSAINNAYLNLSRLNSISDKSSLSEKNRAEAAGYAQALRTALSQALGGSFRMGEGGDELLQNLADNPIKFWSLWNKSKWAGQHSALTQILGDAQGQLGGGLVPGGDFRKAVH